MLIDNPLATYPRLKENPHEPDAERRHAGSRPRRLRIIDCDIHPYLRTPRDSTRSCLALAPASGQYGKGPAASTPRVDYPRFMPNMYRRDAWPAVLDCPADVDFIRPSISTPATSVRC
jgi:hypothetical protein